jgi:hypothetical protein
MYLQEKQIEKRKFGEHFWPVSQRVQMCVYYVYPALSKNGKQLPNGLKRAEAKGIITMLFSITPAILLPFELIGYQNSFKTMTKIFSL